MKLKSSVYRQSIALIPFLFCLCLAEPLPDHGAASVLTIADVTYLTSGKELIYFFVDSPWQLNTDFRVRLRIGSTVIDNTPVIEVAGEVIALPIALLGDVSLHRQLSRAEVEACLPRVSLAETLRVGMPAMFMPYFDSGDSMSQFGSHLDYHPFRDLSEASVALAVGQIDLLLLPRNEITRDDECRFRLLESGHHIEWLLVADRPRDDLLSAALSYCLKQALANDDDGATALFDTTSLAAFYPRSVTKARSLFQRLGSQTRSKAFVDPGLFPTTASIINQALDNCGLATTAGRDGNWNVSLVANFQDWDSSKTEALQTRWRRLVADLSFRRAWIDDPFPDSCILQDRIQSDCVREFSRWAFESCRVIPLGRVGLVFVAREDVRFVFRRGEPASLHTCYRLLKP